MDKLVSYTEMCECLHKETLDVNETSRNLVNNPTILRDKVNEKYKFVKKGFFFKVFSFLFYCLAFIILFPTLWLFYMPKVRGRKNLKKVKNAVFVFNHCFVMDNAIVNVYALPFIRPYILTERDSFQIPVVKDIIRLFRAVPVPSIEDFQTYKNFIRSTDDVLKSGGSISICAEGSLWPYFARIRPFKSGAFRYSVKHNVPIVPIVLSFRKPNWLYRMFGRKKPFINANILEPIYPDTDKPMREAEQSLSELTHETMQTAFTKYNSYVYIDQKRLKKEKAKNDSNV